MSEETETQLFDLAVDMKSAIIDRDEAKLSLCLENCGSYAKEVLELPAFENVLPNCALDNVTLLHILALKGSVDLFLLVLQSVKDLDVDVLSSSYNWTPLHCSVAHGDMEITPHLLDAGADLNAVTSDGQTPLHVAITTEKYNMALCLVEVEADLGLQDSKGNTILHLCLSNNDFRNETMSPIASEFLDELLRRGFPVNEQNSHGDTPIHIFSRVSSNIALLKLLLTCGGTASLFIPNKNGNIPLHLAENEAVVKMLCRGEGINMINYKANDGRTTLHLNCNNASVLRTLLDLGAEANIVDLQGRLPLHLLFTRENPSIEAAEFLLARTTNINTQDLTGHSPLHILCGTGRDCNADLKDTSKVCKTQILIKMCVSHGADVNLQTKKGSSPLHHAVKLRHYHAADTLMNLGANPNLLDFKERSPKYMDPRWYSNYKKSKRKSKAPMTNEYEDIADAWMKQSEKESLSLQELNCSPEEAPRAISRQLTSLQAEMQEVKDVLEELDEQSVIQSMPSSTRQSDHPDTTRSDLPKQCPHLQETVLTLRHEVDTLTRSLTMLVSDTDNGPG